MESFFYYLKLDIISYYFGLSPVHIKNQAKLVLHKHTLIYTHTHSKSLQRMQCEHESFKVAMTIPISVFGLCILSVCSFTKDRIFRVVFSFACSKISAMYFLRLCFIVQLFSLIIYMTHNFNYHFLHW